MAGLGRRRFARGELFTLGHRAYAKDWAEGHQFLSRFDVMSSQVAEDALMSIFVTRPEVLQDIEFEGEYLRSFISYQQSAHAIFRRILDDFDT